MGLEPALKPRFHTAQTSLIDHRCSEHLPVAVAADTALDGRPSKVLISGNAPSATIFRKTHSLIGATLLLAKWPVSRYFGHLSAPTPRTTALFHFRVSNMPLALYQQAQTAIKNIVTPDSSCRCNHMDDKTMGETWADMKTKYKETSRGGLAVNIVEC